MFKPASRRRGHNLYLEQHSRPRVSPDKPRIAFAHALIAFQHCVPPGYYKKGLLELFDHAVTWAAIKHWKHGRRVPPQWVIDRLSAALNERHAELTQARAELAKEKGRRV